MNGYENYIPSEILSSMFSSTTLPTEFDNVLEFIAQQRGVESVKKVSVAQEVVGLLTRETLASWLDMAERLDTVCAKLREWNRLIQNEEDDEEVGVEEM